MTRTSVLRAIALVCFSVLSPMLARSTPVIQGSETMVVLGHICSGCRTCEPIATPRRKEIEQSCIDHFHRTGHPETQGRFAKPSLSPHDSFGYVGGGAALRGEPRFSDEGTWGADYSGILFPKKIWLRWLHGHHEPRHDGSYRTDGPRLLER